MYRLDIEDFTIIMSKATNIKDISYFKRYSDGSNNILFYYTDIKLDVYVQLTSYMNIHIKHGNDLVVKYLMNRYMDNTEELYLHIKCLGERFKEYIKHNELDKWSNK